MGAASRRNSNKSLVFIDKSPDSFDGKNAEIIC
jgi:hypothetical protein